jgi:hypothetical protein
MQYRKWLIPLAVLCLFTGFWSESVVGQMTRADSAAILLDATRRLELEGEGDAARELLDLIIRHFRGTPAAEEAATLLSTSRSRQTERSGRASFIAFSTLYGAWLGVAIPAAFGADEPEPFGAGLLIGAPLGFFASKAFVNKNPMSAGQATLTGFGARWGTWQGIGWREVLDIGEYDDEAPFTAAIIGGLTGLFGAGIIAQQVNPTHGEATMVELGSLWGVWYGAAASIVANDEDDDGALTWALMGGNIGLLASALATRSWKMGAGRARIISAAGLAGGVAGLGLDLLADVDDEETFVAIPAITSAIGLIAGAVMTRNYDSGTPPPDGSGPALVNVQGGSWNVGLPAPQLAKITRPGKRSATSQGIGARVTLFSAKF